MVSKKIKNLVLWVSIPIAFLLALIVVLGVTKIITKELFQSILKWFGIIAGLIAIGIIVYLTIKFIKERNVPEQGLMPLEKNFEIVDNIRTGKRYGDFYSGNYDTIPEYLGEQGNTPVFTTMLTCKKDDHKRLIILNRRPGEWYNWGTLKNPTPEQILEIKRRFASKPIREQVKQRTVETESGDTITTVERFEMPQTEQEKAKEQKEGI